jgi:ABC-2 type transport system permease protein
MSARRAVWEVARRELVERSRSRVLQVSLALLLIASVGGAIAAARLSGHTPTDRVGVVGARSVALEPAIRIQAKAAGRAVRFQQLSSEKSASRAVHDGTVALALVEANQILVKNSQATPAVRVLQGAVAAHAALNRLQSYGLSQNQALSALAPARLPVHVLEPNTRNVASNRALIAIGVIALLATLMAFGQAVAQSVTEEKSSRVVELLLTTVSPRRLLAGKVLGVGVLGLALVLLPAAAALAAGSLAGGAGLPAAAPKAVALVVLWFALGYVFYSVAFAAIGALVSRQEDLQTAMIPLTGLLLCGFVIADVVANTSPNGALGQVAAFLPPFSPLVVPARMVLGDMGMLGLAASIAIDLLATAGMILLAARIYERAILRTGAPVKLRRVLATHSHEVQPADIRPTGTQPMKQTDTKKTELGNTQTRLTPLADVGLRMGAVVLLIAGVVIGFGRPIAIVLVAIGVLLLILHQSLKHLPRRPIH